LITHYEDASRGLQYGYSVLMDHWDYPKAHLAYQGLIFMNDHLCEAMPSPSFVAENTVVCILSQGQERRYRIEGEQHTFFKDEQLDLKSDLAMLLLGKQQGDNVLLREGIGPIEVEIRWIKSIYLDAFHRSLEQFNERFPTTNGLHRFTYNPNSPDPLEDMRTILKACAEASQHMLTEYQTKGLPLSFAAALLGRDPLDAWNTLPTVGIKFQVCRGTLPERNAALQSIKEHGRKGCILDAITLHIIYCLNVEKAVIEVCGPIHTTETVINLLGSRALEAQQNIGKQRGFIAWQNDQLIFQELLDETLKQVANERAGEFSWARRVGFIAPAIPKKDFSQEVRSIIDKVGHVACDPAVAANGNDLLLLSEDMGFRIWSAATFKVPTTWLQPVLIIARDEGHLTADEYGTAINMLALNGHTYISLDSNCLMYQARKDDFSLTNDLSRLIEAVGGPSADLMANTGVLSAFIDLIIKECPDELKVKRIVSETFQSIIKGRPEDQRLLIVLIVQQIKTAKNFVDRHALNWLIGHSIGMPYFSDLLRMWDNYRSNGLAKC